MSKLTLAGVILALSFLGERDRLGAEPMSPQWHY